jgi:hypothetical protein
MYASAVPSTAATNTARLTDRPTACVNPEHAAAEQRRRRPQHPNKRQVDAQADGSRGHRDCGEQRNRNRARQERPGRRRADRPDGRRGEDNHPAKAQTTASTRRAPADEIDHAPARGVDGLCVDRLNADPGAGEERNASQRQLVGEPFSAFQDGLDRGQVAVFSPVHGAAHERQQQGEEPSRSQFHPDGEVCAVPGR